MSSVNLKFRWYHHGRGFHLVSLIEDSLDCFRSRPAEVVEPTHVVRPFQRIALVLEAPVNIGHLVTRISDSDARSEHVGGKDDSAIRKPQLGVLELIAVGLALCVLIAPTEVKRQASGQLLVVLEVAIAG